MCSLIIFIWLFIAQCSLILVGRQVNRCYKGSSMHVIEWSLYFRVLELWALMVVKSSCVILLMLICWHLEREVKSLSMTIQSTDLKVAGVPFVFLQRYWWIRDDSLELTLGLPSKGQPLKWIMIVEYRRVWMLDEVTWGRYWPGHVWCVLNHA